MATITLRSRNGDSVYTSEFNPESTIFHIKKYLKSQIEDEYPGIVEERIRIIFKGKAVSDTIPLDKLGKEAVQLMFDVLVNRECDRATELSGSHFRDIETNDISVKVAVSIKETGKKIMVNPEDLVTFNGRVYLISSRKQILTLRVVVDILRSIKISREDLVRLAVFMLLLCTRNGGVVIILASVFVLEILSKKLASTHHDVLKDADHLCRSLCMFFISLFIIDHSRF